MRAVLTSGLKLAPRRHSGLSLRGALHLVDEAGWYVDGWGSLPGAGLARSLAGNMGETWEASEASDGNWHHATPSSSSCHAADSERKGGMDHHGGSMEPGTRQERVAGGHPSFSFVFSILKS